jgi:hypothetical protein
MKVTQLTSALPPKADMCSALAHVCFGPKADMISFDNLGAKTSMKSVESAAAFACEAVNVAGATTKFD